MTNAFEQHAKAFQHISAYVICKDGQQVGKIAVKFSSRVQAYVHLMGTEMTKGIAGGGGYDRETAAIAEACAKVILKHDKPGEAPSMSAEQRHAIKVIVAAVQDDATHWDNALHAAGFQVFCAV